MDFVLSSIKLNQDLSCFLQHRFLFLWFFFFKIKIFFSFKLGKGADIPCLPQIFFKPLIETSCKNIEFLKIYSHWKKCPLKFKIKFCLLFFLTGLAEWIGVFESCGKWDIFHLNFGYFILSTRLHRSFTTKPVCGIHKTSPLKVIRILISFWIFMIFMR